MDAPPDDLLRELDFWVMGTTARLLLRMEDEHAAAAMLAQAQAELAALEARLTRFDSNSELERLNEARSAEASPELLELLVAAEGYRIASGGRFNIGVGADVIAAGYDRTFMSLAAIDDADRARLGAHMLEHGATRATASSARAVQLDAPPYTIEQNRVTLREGARLDLGGIGKGWAADRIASALTGRSGCSSLVSLGGDVAIRVVDGDEPWPISASVGDAGRITLALSYGGMATSGWDGRMWRRDDAEVAAHHVIDPGTGASAVTDIMRITVVADSCMDAEVWAKSLMLVGSAAAAAEAHERGIAAIIVRADGTSTKTGALAG